MVSLRTCRYLVETLAETRIQLCGRLVARIDGRRIDEELPGRQGRLAFAYLVVHRHRPVTRDELIEALWASTARLRPAEPAPVEAPRCCSGRGTTRRPARPPRKRRGWTSRPRPKGSTVAESAAARGDWKGAWGPGRVAQHVSARVFLPGEESAWIDEQRRRLEQIHLRSLELVGDACLRIGGGELATAERAARSAIKLSPYSESAHRLLMEVLAARGNPAEALLVYDVLRVRLREELGTSPSEATAGPAPAPTGLRSRQAPASRPPARLVLLGAAGARAELLTVDLRRAREVALVRRPFGVEHRVRHGPAPSSRALPAARSCGRRGSCSRTRSRSEKAATIACSIGS